MAASSVTRPYRRLEGDSSRDTDDEEEDGLQYQAPLYEVNRPINTYGATQRVGTVYSKSPSGMMQAGNNLVKYFRRSTNCWYKS